VPVYLEARQRREMASARFETAIQDFQQSTEECLQDLIQAMVDMYNERSAKLDDYECMLKQEYVHNDDVRSKMQANIEESANAASQMFERLLKRVLQQESMEVRETTLPTGALTQAMALNSP
jgi:type I restriction-modification system DNA methylase subunit